MKTNQVMESIDRELEGVIVRQRTKDNYFNLNDILCLVDSERIKQRLSRINFDKFLLTDNVKAFLIALETEIGSKPYIRGAKNRDGWVHPYFALKILTYHNPQFEVKVYKWLWDLLMQYRCNSGDSYSRMCGVLYKYSKQQSRFNVAISMLANAIKVLLEVEDWNKATKQQLEMRDQLHNSICDITTALKDSKQGIRLGLQAFAERYKQFEGREVLGYKL